MAAHLQARGLENGTRQASVFEFGAVFIAFITAVIGLRLYVRLFITRVVGVDDALMVVGTVFTFGLTVASMVAAYYGVGKRTADISSEDTIHMLQAVYSTRLLYVVGIGLVKQSLLMFYLRLDRRPRMRGAVYVLSFCSAAFSVASFFILAFSCFPPALFWGGTSGTGGCMGAKSQQAFYDANGIINIVLDVAIYITPMPMFWNIQIPLRSKIVLMSIFGLGFISVAAGCVRYYYVRLLAGESTSQYYYMDLADSLNWCGVEIYLAIFCGSTPSFKAFFSKHFPRLFGGQSSDPGAAGRVSDPQRPNHHLHHHPAGAGQFALHTFGGTPFRQRSAAGHTTVLVSSGHNLKRHHRRGFTEMLDSGVSAITTTDGDGRGSEEAIVSPASPSIAVEREVWMKVERDGEHATDAALEASRLGK